jgi:predicted aldo/keto reductase-like oxidoreductase
VLGARGAVKGLEKARAEGFVRHVGITGHTRPEVISQALHEYPFESILVPVSAADRHLADFAESVVPEAVEKGVAVAGMKSLKGAENHGAFDPEPYLRYALSLPISTLTVGFRRASDVEADLAIAARFAPMSREEMHALEASTRAWATADVLWWKRR